MKANLLPFAWNNQGRKILLLILTADKELVKSLPEQSTRRWCKLASILIMFTFV